MTKHTIIFYGKLSKNVREKNRKRDMAMDVYRKFWKIPVAFTAKEVYDFLTQENWDAAPSI